MLILFEYEATVRRYFNLEGPRLWVGPIFEFLFNSVCPHEILFGCHAPDPIWMSESYFDVAKCAHGSHAVNDATFCAGQQHG